MAEKILLTVNGEKHDLEVGSRPYQVAPWHTLAQTLGETLGLTGTKVVATTAPAQPARSLWKGNRSSPA
jgi:aerobic-type carbon monoxide dehydrogenase small subunit (CoxS/CutS family)